MIAVFTGSVRGRPTTTAAASAHLGLLDASAHAVCVNGSAFLFLFHSKNPSSGSAGSTSYADGNVRAVFIRCDFDHLKKSMPCVIASIVSSSPLCGVPRVMT